MNSLCRKDNVSIQVETRIYCVFTYQNVNFDCSKPFAEWRICMGLERNVTRS